LGHIADAEACVDLVRDNIDPLTNFLVDRMNDESLTVREAAGETVGRFSEHVLSDFLDKHKTVMPCLIKVVQELHTCKHDMTI
jgi:hypothetical protein